MFESLSMVLMGGLFYWFYCFEISVQVFRCIFQKYDILQFEKCQHATVKLDHFHPNKLGVNI